MSKTVTVKTLDDIDIADRVIRTHFDTHGETMVVVKNAEETLTDAQRAYYFVLAGIIGADLGNTKDEQHQYFKERYLLNIYIADIDNHPEYEGVADNMQLIKKQCPEQFPAMRRLVMSGLSITKTTKQNMVDLLTEVLAMAREHQIRLPLPPRAGLVPDWEK